MTLPTLFGTSSAPTDNGTQAGPGPVSVTPPASMQLGDRVLVWLQQRTTGAESTFRVTTTGGQSWQPVVEQGATNSGAALWTCRFNGTWAADPAFDNSNAATTPFTAFMMVWRPSASSMFIDVSVSPVASSYAAPTTPFTVTIPAITTRKTDEVALAMWSSIDDNTWGSLTGGWTGIGSAQYRNASGSQQSMSFAYKEMASPGSTGSVSQNQATNGGDAGIVCMLSIYERSADFSSGSPKVDLWWGGENSTDGTTITAAILDGGTTLNAATGAWTLVGASTNLKVATSGEHSFGDGRKIRIGSAIYDDVGSTRGMSIDHTSQGATAKYAAWVKSVTVSKMSMGVWYRPGMPEQGFESFSHIGMQDAGFTGIAAFNIQNFDIGFHRTYLENVLSELQQGPRLTKDAWYWVTLRYDATNNLGEMAIYDESLVQVGVTVALRLGTSPANCEDVLLGTFGGNLSSPGAFFTYFDDAIVDFTTAAFPLAPSIPLIEPPSYGVDRPWLADVIATPPLSNSELRDASAWF